MDPSKFPTDNMYKFIALLGMVLLVASIYASWQLNDRLGTHQWEEALHEHNMKMLLKYQQEEKEPKIKELYFQMYITENARGAHPKNAQAEDQKFMAQLGRNRWLLNLGTGSGIAITMLGFYLWYTKLQKHLDKAVAQGIKVELPGSRNVSMA